MRTTTPAVFCGDKAQINTLNEMQLLHQSCTDARNTISYVSSVYHPLGPDENLVKRMANYVVVASTIYEIAKIGKDTLSLLLCKKW